MVIAIPYPAGPTTLVFDQFTDTNGTAIGSHTIAPTNVPATSWSNLAGTANIQSNRAAAATFASSVMSMACNPGQADVTVTATINVPSAGSAALSARIQNYSNLWLLQLNDSPNTVVLYDRIANTYTARASASMSIAASTDYAMKLIMSGTSFIGTVDGANEVSYSSATHQAQTQMGLQCSSGATFSADDFKVTTP